MSLKEKIIKDFLNVEISKNKKYKDFLKLTNILELTKKEGAGSREKWYKDGKAVLSLHFPHGKSSIGIGRAKDIKKMILKLTKEGYVEIH